MDQFIKRYFKVSMWLFLPAITIWMLVLYPSVSKGQEKSGQKIYLPSLMANNSTQFSRIETFIGSDSSSTPSATGNVSSFLLVNASTNKDIRALKDNDVVDLSKTPHINIRAQTNPATVGSVVFDLNGVKALENIAPYALAGDIKGDYWDWTPTPGNYLLNAIAYTQHMAQGSAGADKSIHFTVVNGPR